MSLFIRITRGYEQVKEWVNKVADNSVSCIVYEHTGEKTKKVHIHLLVEGAKVSTETLKRWLSSGPMDMYARSDWSFKEKYDNKPVDRGCITYMSKGHLDPVFVRNIDDQTIYELKNKWVVYKGNNDKPDTNKATQYQMLLEMVDIVKSNGVDLCEVSAVFRVISQTLRKYQMVTSLYKMRDYYDSIRLYVEHHSVHDDFCNLIARSYSTNYFPK
jgi:hypothetical protein